MNKELYSGTVPQTHIRSKTVNFKAICDPCLQGCFGLHYQYHLDVMVKSQYPSEALTRGPMTPYTPHNISNIHNIDLIPPPPQYLLNLVNIYEFLLPPLISANPHYSLFIPTAPLISTISDNPHPISNILLPLSISANPHYPLLIPTTPLISTNSANPTQYLTSNNPHSPS